MITIKIRCERCGWFIESSDGQFDEAVRKAIGHAEKTKHDLTVYGGIIKAEQ